MIDQLILIALISVVIIYAVYAISYETYDEPIKEDIKIKAKKQCEPTTMKGYYDVPEDVSAQRVDDIYKGARESDLYPTKPVANYVYNASYRMATGYDQNVPKYVWAPPVTCTDDKLGCSDQNRQCLTDLSQLDNTDANAMYQEVVKHSSAHKPGYTRVKPAASYI